MKKVTLFLCSVFVAALLNAQPPQQKQAISAGTTTTTGTAPAAEQPKLDVTKVLKFNEENHDFGKIPYGKPQEFDVVITNMSKDSVKIENVKVGCGCTTPRYQQNKTYAPGETFKVTLGFSGYADGPFEKYVNIFFNDGMEKQVKFHGVGYKVPETPAPANEGVQKLKSAGQ